MTLGLGPGREFDAIRSFVGADGMPDDVLLGPGDDAAILDGAWVVSCDLSVEDVHFKRAWLSNREIGYRAAAVALSDLAAMGARPVALVVATAMPAREGGLDAIQAGIREAAAEAGAAVVGGDVSTSIEALVVDVTVLGRSDAPVLRSAARNGQELWVTGPLGGAAAAVRLWLEGREPPASLRRAFARPPIRTALAEELAGLDGMGAMIDLSDGLAGDAGHLSVGSGMRVTIDADALPILPAVREAVGDDEAESVALRGGEDYELLFTADPGTVDAEDIERRHGAALTRIGRVESGRGVWLASGSGDPVALSGGGFDHLRHET